MNILKCQACKLIFEGLNINFCPSCKHSVKVIASYPEHYEEEKYAIEEGQIPPEEIRD